MNYHNPSDYIEVYESVATWGTEPRALWWGPQEPWEYLWGLLALQHFDGLDSYVVRRAGADPIIPDLKAFWADITYWARTGWGAMGTWLASVNAYINALWNNILAGLAATAAAIRAEISGVVNYISNIYTWVVWNLVDNIRSFAARLFQPIIETWYAVISTLDNWFGYIYEAISAFLQAPVQWIIDIAGDLYAWLGSIKDAIWDALISTSDIIGAYLGSKLTAFAGTLTPWLENIWAAISSFLETPRQWILDMAGGLWQGLDSIRASIWDALAASVPMIGAELYTSRVQATPVFMDQLRDVLIWLWDVIKAAFIFVTQDLMPAVYAAAAGALGALKDEFTNLIGLAYDEILQKATALVPVTPERSAGIAAGMFGAAVGFGSLAHGMALAVEALPNIKYMGVHYLSAFVARMGSFGTISSATMGVIAALAIREPFGYYMKSILRPTQPREMDLQIMAVKPDIPIEAFRQGMKYQGYTDYWIDAFERTMYHEPSYFEMSMLGEDEAATPEWLFTKSRRSGYTEADAAVFVSSMIKKVTRDQRKEYYKQAFNAFKEGYISADQFKAHLDHLDIRPEAKDLATRAANMAYETDLNKELVSLYRRSFQEDLITEADLRASLSALGMLQQRVEAIIDLEWVRKEPKILKAERKEIETEWRDVQSKYSRLYIESFRRGLITEQLLVAYLLAIGLTDRAAKATARYEALKLVPKPKPLEIIIPSLPLPPEPPVYED